VKRPRLLDLYSGAGGMAMGLFRAGFDVVGVDHQPQPHYPFPFILGDAIDVLRRMLAGEKFLATGGRWYGIEDFDAVHASPPCQRYSCSAKGAGTSKRHPDLVEPTRQVLRASGLPWTMENVPGSPLNASIVLCGSMFGLEVRRHRLFETEPCLFRLVPSCDHSGRVFSVFGHGAGNRNGKKRSDTGTVAEWRRAMGIDWMTRNELSQSIPPAYGFFIGSQLIRILDQGEV
jgi:DNA (cytosine-5)-methyltransferase 1